MRRDPIRPRWRCGEPACPRHHWQSVTAMGEFDDLDVALGALESHYARAHPEQEEVIPDARVLAA